MKTLRALLTILMITAVMFGYGQDYAFSVMVNKGSNQINRGSSWEQLKTGAELQSGDQLKVSDNAYIGLLHSGGKTIEVKAAGTYSVADLEKRVPAGQSVAGKYADFLNKQMSAEAKKNRLSATGAVHRALGVAAINVLMPESAPVYNDEAVIRWEAVDADDVTYTVKVMNMFEEVLLSEEVEGTKYRIDFSDDKFVDETTLLLVVTTSEDETIKSNMIPMTRLSAGEKAEIREDLLALKQDVDAETALNNYILAGFYEENNLLVDALTKYEEAVALAPEVNAFQAYEEVLLRNGLKKEN